MISVCREQRVHQRQQKERVATKRKVSSFILVSCFGILRTASSWARKVFVGSPMENTANAKLTAYVAELNAAKHAVHRLRQIEQHLQETVQRQEDELVKLRLSQFKSDSDKNLNKHLKARIAVQADEYEKLRGRALRAEKLVTVRDAQLEDAKNVVRALRKKWNTLQQQQEDIQNAIVQMAEANKSKDSPLEAKEESAGQESDANSSNGGETTGAGKDTTTPNRTVDVEMSSPANHSLSAGSLMRLKEYSTSLRKRCDKQEDTIEKQKKQMKKMKMTIHEYKERCNRQRDAIRKLKQHAGIASVSSLSELSSSLFKTNIESSKNKSTNLPPWNFRAYSIRRNKKSNSRVKDNSAEISHESKQVLIENLRDRIEREAAAALLNSQRQLKNEYERKLLEARNFSEQREAKVENELNKLKSTIVRLLTVVGNPNSVDTEKILNGVQQVLDTQNNPNALDTPQSNSIAEEMVLEKSKHDPDITLAKEQRPDRTLNTNDAARPSPDPHVKDKMKKSKMKLKSPLWSSSDSEIDDNVDADAYTSDESSLDLYA